MAYTINSAKDSQGNEDQFVAEAQRQLAAIESYKRAHGGDYEGAFRAVTGTPWPEGRSLKVKNGRAEMTKDRTVKSVLGKYVAPIAAGALTGGAALGAFGGGAAAAGAGGVGLGETGAVTGLGGSGLAGSAGGIGATSVGAGGGWVPAAAGGLGKVAAGAGANAATDALTGGATEAAGGIDWSDIVKKLALGLAPLGAGVAAHQLSGAGDPVQANIPPELTQMLQTAMQRMTAQQPLVDAVNKQSLAGLPTYAKGGS